MIKIESTARGRPSLARMGRIARAVQSGQTALIAGHGNSLRALVKYLDLIDEDRVVDLDIPTGVPMIYEFDSQPNPLRHYFLDNREAPTP